MFKLGTLKDANSIARSPFLQSDDVRFDQSPPSLMQAWRSYRVCVKRSTHVNMATFSDLRPDECYDVLVSHLRATLFKHPVSINLLTRDRRCEYDPNVPPWTPKAAYVDLLLAQQRLPLNLETDILRERSANAAAAESSARAAGARGGGSNTTAVRK